MEAFIHLMVSLVARMVKNLPIMWETWVQSLDWKDPLEKGMTMTPVFLPGEFHGRGAWQATVKSWSTYYMLGTILEAE